MFHYSTLVCVHSFGRKDGGGRFAPGYPIDNSANILANYYLTKKLQCQFNRTQNVDL